MLSAPCTRGPSRAFTVSFLLSSLVRWPPSPAQKTFKMPWKFKTNKDQALKPPAFPNHESCDQMQTEVVYLIKIKPSFPFSFFSFSSSTPFNACGKIHQLEAVIYEIWQRSFRSQYFAKSKVLWLAYNLLLFFYFSPLAPFHWGFELLTAEQMKYAHEAWRLRFCALLYSLPQLYFAWVLNNSRSTEEPLCLYVQNIQLSA